MTGIGLSVSKCRAQDRMQEHRANDLTTIVVQTYTIAGLKYGCVIGIQASISARPDGSAQLPCDDENRQFMIVFALGN